MTPTLLVSLAIGLAKPVITLKKPVRPTLLVSCANGLENPLITIQKEDVTSIAGLMGNWSPEPSDNTTEGRSHGQIGLVNPVITRQKGDETNIAGLSAVNIVNLLITLQKTDDHKTNIADPMGYHYRVSKYAHLTVIKCLKPLDFRWFCPLDPT